MSVTLIPSMAFAAPADDAITEGMAEDTGADTKDEASPVYEISVSGLKTEAVYDGTEPFDLSGGGLTKPLPLRV